MKLCTIDNLRQAKNLTSINKSNKQKPLDASRKAASKTNPSEAIEEIAEKVVDNSMRAGFILHAWEDQEWEKIEAMSR